MSEPSAEVEVEIVPWLSEILGRQNRFVMRRKIREGENLTDLFAGMASEDRRFGERIFDLGRRKLRIQIIVLVNNRLASLQEGLQTKLFRDFKVTLLPVSSGG